MSFDAEFAPEGPDDAINEVVDLLTILPVEPEGYEPETVLTVFGVPVDGSGAFWDEDDAGEEAVFVPFDQLIPVEEPYEPDWQPVADDDAAARECMREQINDAYARAETAWSAEEADEILWSSLPEGAGLMDEGWL